VGVWDITKRRNELPRLEAMLKAHRQEVLCLRFNAHHQTFITGGNEHAIHVWSISSYQQLARLEGHSAPVTCLALDGNFLLSGAEDAGLFSKLEAAGAFSKAEKLLPLADDLKLLSTAEYLLNVPANLLALGAVVLLGGEFALITAVPDDNAALLGVQVVTGLLAGGGAVVLLASSFLFSLLQGTN